MWLLTHQFLFFGDGRVAVGMTNGWRKAGYGWSMSWGSVDEKKCGESGFFFICINTD
jgi:hypothetical protein